MFTRLATCTRSLATIFSVGALLFAVGCGDDGLGANTDGGDDLSATADLSSNAVDMAHDQATSSKFDLAGADFGGILCGAQTCSGANICCLVPNLQAGTATSMCTAASACSDGGIPATCDGPEDCSSGTPNCCVALSLGSGGMSAGGGASCTGSCPASVTQMGQGGTVNTKLCHGPSDCANYNGTAPVLGSAPFDKCCGYPGVSFRFCAPGLITLVATQITCD